jgi:AcrR family transcriptional regulator
MTEFSGRAVPERILPLLWRHHHPAGPAKGRPPRLSVDTVVGAAIDRADADGLDAASMGRLGKDLGVGTMTIYTYVPSRDELVDLMVDEVLTRRALPGPGEPRPAGWRDQVHLYADRTRAMYAAHPWLAQVSQVRPPIGPGMLAEREYVLSVVAGLGLPLGRVNTAAVTIQAFVTTAARALAEIDLVRRDTGETNDAWWMRRQDLWETWFDVDRHPAMTALWNAGGFDRGADDQVLDAYAYGLGLILDGLERASRERPPGS